MASKFLLFLRLCLIIPGTIGFGMPDFIDIFKPMVVATTTASYTTTEPEIESSPYCEANTECEGGGVLSERLVQECCPCVCEEEGWCRLCLDTAVCECICGNPNVTQTEPEDPTPPPLTTGAVAEALADVKEWLQQVADEVIGNRSAIETCFPDHDIRRILHPIRNKANTALEAAMRACQILENTTTLDNPDLLRALDELAFQLDKTKLRLEQFMRAITQIIADQLGLSTDPPFEWDNPDHTSGILDAWNPDTESCQHVKELLRIWHPTFWAWGVWQWGSLWVMLCWSWFCVVYIRITIIVKAWWWWLWTPWQWLWPFHWCWWWGLFPAVL